MSTTFHAYGANPHRRLPQHCPYCGGTSLYPDERDDFAWSCGECQRVFALAFLAQKPLVSARESLSTQEALQSSLAWIAQSTLARKEHQHVH